MKKIILTVMTILVLLPMTFAQTTDVEAGLTPENPLYFIDTLGEQISLRLTLNDDDKAEKHILYAKERNAELELISDEIEIVKLQERFENHLQNANQLSMMNREQELNQIRNRNVEVLELLKQDLPEQAIEGIDKAIENTKQLRFEYQEQEMKMEMNQVQSYQEKFLKEFNMDVFEIKIDNETRQYLVTENNIQEITQFDDIDYTITIKDKQKALELYNKYKNKASFTYDEIKDVITGNVIEIPNNLKAKLLLLIANSEE